MRRIVQNLLLVTLLMTYGYGGCTSSVGPLLEEPLELERATSGTFTATTLNIHGMSSTLTGDDTPKRMKGIAKALREFSGIFCMQEHFLYGENSPTEDIIGHGFAHLVRFTKRLGWKPYSSGLSILSAFRVAATRMHHYSVCNGDLSSGNDCLAAKGFMVVRTEIAPGVEIDIYTTHLDSGSGPKDAAARAKQFAELLDFVTDYSDGRPVLMLADFNTRWDRKTDREMFNRFLASSGLLVAPSGAPVCPEHFKLDGILYRSGESIKLSVKEVRDIRERFRNEDGYLSDHHPMSITFAWQTT